METDLERIENLNFFTSMFWCDYIRLSLHITTENLNFLLSRLLWRGGVYYTFFFFMCEDGALFGSSV